MSKKLWNSSVHNNLNPQKVIEINSSSWKYLPINSWIKRQEKTGNPTKKLMIKPNLISHNSKKKNIKCRMYVRSSEK